MVTSVPLFKDLEFLLFCSFINSPFFPILPISVLVVKMPQLLVTDPEISQAPVTGPIYYEIGIPETLKWYCMFQILKHPLGRYTVENN